MKDDKDDKDNKDDKVYLLHFRDAILRVLDYTAEGRESFFGDAKTQDAVIRNLEIMGEAVKHLSKELRASQEHVPWKRIAGMRDKMIHAYFGVNLDLVWNAVVNELPSLGKEVDRICKELSEAED